VTSRPPGSRARGREGQRGAAAVEAALVISFFLAPILGGVLTLGERLWQAQKQPPYDARTVSSQVVGRFGCAELVDRVKTTLVNNTAHLDVPLEAGWIAVDVVDVLPTVGAIVEIGISVPALDGLGSPTVTEASERLEHVSVTTETCL
jgi:hypothetical protein